MPTTTKPDHDPRSSYLSAVRESQAAVLDALRVWSDLGQQLTRDLRLPIARIDLNQAVDRAFDLAEQTLAAHHQLARTLAGVATRQVDIAAHTVTETIDTTTETADPTVVETLKGTAGARAHQPQGQLRDHQERLEQPPTSKADPAKATPPKQDRRPDGRPYEDRSLEELRERAAELQIEGRSTMTKDQLITTLRQQTK